MNLTEVNLSILPPDWVWAVVVFSKLILAVVRSTAGLTVVVWRVVQRATPCLTEQTASRVIRALEADGNQTHCGPW